MTCAATERFNHLTREYGGSGRAEGWGVDRRELLYSRAMFRPTPQRPRRGDSTRLSTAGYRSVLTTVQSIVAVAIQSGSGRRCQQSGSEATGTDGELRPSAAAQGWRQRPEDGNGVSIHPVTGGRRWRQRSTSRRRGDGGGVILSSELTMSTRCR